MRTTNFHSTQKDYSTAFSPFCLTKNREFSLNIAKLYKTKTTINKN